jgi:hypothetical protein
VPECKAFQFFRSGEFLPMLHLAVFSTMILERARGSMGGRFSAAIAIAYPGQVLSTISCELRQCRSVAELR